MIFDLVRDFADALNAMPPEHPRHRLLKLLDEAIRRDIHFIARHRADYPQALFQCVWNNGWWYDSPESGRHYVAGKAPGGDAGVFLHKYLAKWRSTTEAFSSRCWLMSLRPPAAHLDSPLRMRLCGHQGCVSFVAYSPDDSLLVTGDTPGIFGADVQCSVRIWDANTGALLNELICDQGVTAAAISDDGLQLATGSSDRTIRIWSLPDCRCLATLPGHQDTVSFLLFSPDRRCLISASGAPMDPLDATLRFWSLHDYQATRVMGADDKKWMVALSISLDGRRLHAIREDGVRLTWDIFSGVERSRCDLGGRMQINCAAFSRDAARVAFGTLFDSGLHDTHSGAKIASLSDAATMHNCFAFSPNGSLLAAGAGTALDRRADFGLAANKTLQLFDAESGDSVCELIGHGAGVSSVAFSNGGRRIVSGSADGVVLVWACDALTAATRMTIDDVGYVAFSSAGDRLIAGSANSRSVHPDHGFVVPEWDVATCRRLRDFPSRESQIHHAIVSNDRRWIVGSTRNWLHGSSEPDVVRVWSVETGIEQCVISLQGGDTPMRFAVSPDGEHLALVVKNSSLQTSIQVRSALTGEMIRQVTDYPENISCVAFSSDAALLAIGCIDKVIRLLDAGTGKLVRTLRCHRKPLEMAFGLHDLTLSVLQGDDYESRRFVVVFDSRFGEGLDLVDGVCDVSALAAGTSRHRAVSTAGETVVEVPSERTCVAVLPRQFDRIVANPDGITWAGMEGRQLSLFQLVGRSEWR